MLCKDGHSNWNPDMIYFNNTEVRTTPAYDVQRLFSVYGGDRYVSSRLSIDQVPQAVDGAQLQKRIGASLVRDSKTGRSYLKLVNALPVPLQLKAEGISIPATAHTEGFEGKPTDQRISLSQGTAGSSLQLPPYSMRVIEL